MGKRETTTSARG